MTDSPAEKKPEAAPSADDAPVVRSAGGPAGAPAPASDVRASDADRDRVADILREALAEGRLNAEEHGERLDTVYAARTVGELEPVVRDLPAPASGGSGAPAAGPGASAEYEEPGGTDSGENLVAVFSSSTRKGRWRVPKKINATAVFGSVEIDLTRAVYTHRHIRINATAVFGSVEIRVPENVTLQQKGTGVFGAFDVHTMESADAQAPVVLVQGAAVFGSVEAKPKVGKRLRDFRDRLRKELS